MGARKSVFRNLSYGFAVATLAATPILRELSTFAGSAFDTLFVERVHDLYDDWIYVDYLAVVVAVLLATLAVVAILMFADRISPSAGRDAKRVVTMAVAVYLWLYLLERYSVRQLLSDEARIVAALFFIALAIRFRGQLDRALDLATFVLVPVGLVFMVNAAAASLILVPDGQVPISHQRTLAEPWPADRANRPRVVWILFDEWDQAVSFEGWNVAENLPNLARLIGESFHADNAIQANGMTRRSVPTMTTGREAVSYRVDRHDTLSVEFEGADGYVSWPSVATVFSRAREMKRNIGILSQQIPAYCRMFYAVATRCWEFGRWWNNERRTVLSRTVSFYAALPRYLAFIGDIGGGIGEPFIHDRGADYQTKYYEPFLEANLDAATDQGLDLVFAHWWLPHLPFHYDRVTNAFLPACCSKTDEQGYHDNLVLTDMTVARIRKAMESAGAWDTSTVIMSSDHQNRLRSEDGRIPLIIKFAGQREGYRYNERFDMKYFGPMIMAIIRGDIASARELVDFIETSRRSPPEPL